MASFYQDGVTAELRVPELNPVNGQPSPLYFTELAVHLLWIRLCLLYSTIVAMFR
jgi:hypothetical protein